MKKTALIIGIGGQDGALLAKLLIKKKYNVIGTSNHIDKFKLFRLRQLKIFEKVKIFKYSTSNKKKLKKIIEKSEPQEIYVLAGPSIPKRSFDNPGIYLNTYIKRTLEILDLNLEFKKKIFLASSSELFGQARDSYKSENSKYSPNNPYGISMFNVITLANIYRKEYNMFISTGIFFNHESSLRSMNFVSKKIVFNFVKYLSTKTPFQIGNMNSKRDWSAAEDVVEGIYLSTNHKHSDNYVFASGKTHSIKDFILQVAKKINLEVYFKGKGINTKCLCKKTNKLIIETSSKYFRNDDLKCHIGNISKAKKILKWRPKKSFKKMVYDMVTFEIKNSNKNKVNE